MKIVGFFNPTYSDNKKFVDKVMEDINKLQEDGQAVEIQYQPMITLSGSIVYSALVIGRKED